MKELPVSLITFKCEEDSRLKKKGREESAEKGKPKQREKWEFFKEKVDFHPWKLP